MRSRPIPLPPGFNPPHNPRFRRRSGNPYVPDVVERVRVLVEGSSGLERAGFTRRLGHALALEVRWLLLL